jgi:hypothetical protein
MKFLNHSKKDGEKTEQCEGQHVKDYWLCQYFSDPEGPKNERRRLPGAVSQPGRQKYVPAGDTRESPVGFRN